MKIAILGGSFDPPHVGHMLVAAQVKKLLNIDKVWLMPTFSHPFQKSLSPAKDRLAMTKLLEDDQIIASDFEIVKKGVSYTINTLDQLSKLHPLDTFFWIIGSDQIDDFPKWNRWEEIIQKYHLIVYARNEDPKRLEEKMQEIFHMPVLPGTIHILNTKELMTSNTSSTQVRERIKKRQAIRGLVSKKVEEYIIAHELYK